jgi:hypothetical protein
LLQAEKVNLPSASGTIFFSSYYYQLTTQTTTTLLSL